MSALRPLSAFVASILLASLLVGCASLPTDGPCHGDSQHFADGNEPRNSSRRLPNRRPDTDGEHWIHDARERRLAAHRPFWHEPTLAEELELAPEQIAAFDRAFEAALENRYRGHRDRRTAEARRTAALAAGDWPAAKKANRELAQALTRLALIDSELKIEVFEEMREDQRQRLAEFHPGLADGSWLPPENL